MNIKKIDGETVLTIEGLMVSPECPVCVDLFRASIELRLQWSNIPDLSGVEDESRGSKGAKISITGSLNELRAANGMYNLGRFWGTTYSMTLKKAVEEDVRRLKEKIREEKRRLKEKAAKKKKEREKLLRKPKLTGCTIYGAQ